MIWSSTVSKIFFEFHSEVIASVLAAAVIELEVAVIAVVLEVIEVSVVSSYMATIIVIPYVPVVVWIFTLPVMTDTVEVAVEATLKALDVAIIATVVEVLQADSVAAN